MSEFHIPPTPKKAARAATTMPEERYMTIADFAGWAKLCKASVYNRLAAGELHAVKLGRHTLIKVSEAERWAKAEERPAEIKFDGRKQGRGA